MKKLLCLFVAVGAGMAAGQEAVPTVVEGATYQFGNTYAGLYADKGHPDGGNVTMTGGEVHDLYGAWCPRGDAGHSTVISAEHIDKENIRNFRLTAAGFSMQVQTIAAGPA